MNIMPLAEEALFEGHPVAHIVAYYERQRLARIAQRNRDAAEERRRRILRFGR